MQRLFREGPRGKRRNRHGQRENFATLARSTQAGVKGAPCRAPRSRSRTGNSSFWWAPSGCGKSTILRDDRGASRDHLRGGGGGGGGGGRGEVEIAGPRSSTRWNRPEARHRHGVSRTTRFYPHMTVRKNMEYGLERTRACRAPEIERRIAQAARNACRSRSISTASRGSFRAGSASASPWAAPSCASRRCSSSTNPCRTSTPKLRTPVARRVEGPAYTARRHLRLRHPRPGRGAMSLADRIVDHVRGAASSRSAHPWTCMSGPPAVSSPNSSARRR